MSSNSGSEVVHSYPEPSTYIKLALFLAVFTLIEVATYYIHANVLLITLVLIFLMTVKFVLVVGYYMHLKFDSRLLTFVFAAGLMVALSIMLVMIALFGNY